MPLFEPSTAPAGQQPKRHGEPIYAYYRDSERPRVAAIRALLEEWFLELTENERRDLQQRFRSPTERHHRSAVFELFLHHFLLRCGFEVEFHPEIAGVRTHPDFLVSRNGEALFYLEAIAVSNSAREEAEVNRMNQVYDALNNLQSPDFYLGLRVEGAPQTPVPAARLRSALARWLAKGVDRRDVHRSFSTTPLSASRNYSVNIPSVNAFPPFLFDYAPIGKQKLFSEHPVWTVSMSFSSRELR